MTQPEPWNRCEDCRQLIGPDGSGHLDCRQLIGPDGSGHLDWCPFAGDVVVPKRRAGTSRLPDFTRSGNS